MKNLILLSATIINAASFSDLTVPRENVSNEYTKHYVVECSESIKVDNTGKQLEHSIVGFGSTIPEFGKMENATLRIERYSIHNYGKHVKNYLNNYTSELNESGYFKLIFANNDTMIIGDSHKLPIEVKSMFENNQTTIYDKDYNWSIRKYMEKYGDNYKSHLDTSTIVDIDLDISRFTGVPNMLGRSIYVKNKETSIKFTSCSVIRSETKDKDIYKEVIGVNDTDTYKSTVLMNVFGGKTLIQKYSEVAIEDKVYNDKKTMSISKFKSVNLDKVWDFYKSNNEVITNFNFICLFEDEVDACNSYRLR